jgi:hypothetical protein
MRLSIPLLLVMRKLKLKYEFRYVPKQLRKWFPPFGQPVLVLVAVGCGAEDGVDGL